MLPTPELFPFVITSGRNSDMCDIIVIEIYKEGRKENAFT